MLKSIKTLKSLRIIASLVAGIAASSAASADYLNFSYTFTDNTVVSGSFSGTINGDFVENISNISVNYGALFQGSVYAFGYNPNPPGGANDQIDPVVSFNGAKNNFIFTTSPNTSVSAFGDMFYYANNTPGYSAVFVQNIATNMNSPEDPDAYFVRIDNNPRWVLTAVPEPESYAMLLAGLGMLGMAARRRK